MRGLCVVAAALSGVALGAWFSPARALTLPPHPRLIVCGNLSDQTPRLQELRAVIDSSSSWVTWNPRKRALFLAMRSLRAGAHYWTAYDTTATTWFNQELQYQVVATLSLADMLMKDQPVYFPGYQRQYAKRARGVLNYWREAGLPYWPGGDLGVAELLAGYAVYQDWCYDFMDTATRRANAKAMYHLLTDSTLYTVANNENIMYGWYDDNHLGVVFGAVGLATLSLDTEETYWTSTQRDSIETLRVIAASRIRDYLDASFPHDGGGIEGVTYANYGLNLALPYGLATDRLAALSPPALPQNMRVYTPLRAAQQAATWYLYEQLPDNPSGGTPVNDTLSPPWDFHAQWRSWAWLLAFATQSRPSAALPLFYTMYSPDVIDGAVQRPFNEAYPSWESDPFDFIPTQPPNQQVGFLNNCGILLGWPTDDVPSTWFVDPDTLPASRSFTGCGYSYFRHELHPLSDGAPAWDPDSWLVTFQCRPDPDYHPGYPWRGHEQQDVNHFTAFMQGEPLFYDCGYSGWGDPSWVSGAHSLHEINENSQGWRGFLSAARTGTPLGSVFGLGSSAASWAGGDNAKCWTQPGPLAGVARSQRHLFVLPRPGFNNTDQPYVVVYDDFLFNNDQTVAIRAQFHTGNLVSEPLIVHNTWSPKAAEWTKGPARAILTVLAPQDINSLYATQFTPDVPDMFPTHWVLHAPAPTRTSAAQQFAFLIEMRPADSSYPQLSWTALQTTDSRALAWQINSGQLLDVVGMRPADDTGSWTIYGPHGPITGDSQFVIMRYSQSSESPEAIEAGTMIGGTALRCDDQLVALLQSSGRGGMTFSRDGVSIWTADGDTPGYFIGPFTPGSARINGVALPLSMLPCPAGARCMPTGGEPAEPQAGGPTAGGNDAWVTRRVVPNPLRPGSLIEWSAEAKAIAMEVYDVKGRLVRTIEDDGRLHGLRLRWDGRTASGQGMPAGLYLVRIRQGASSWTRKVLYLP